MLCKHCLHWRITNQSAKTLQLMLGANVEDLQIGKTTFLRLLNKV